MGRSKSPRTPVDAVVILHFPAGVDIEPLAIDAVRLVRPRRFDDPRGYFAEIANHRALADALQLDAPFVQDNLSRSTAAGTIRALHLQRAPNAQGKLVRVTRGAIEDVAVDARRGSSTYGQHVMVTLHDDDLSMLWVPPGFLHGFVTLRPDTEVTYKVTAYYSQADEVGVRWNDPDLGIDWGIDDDRAVLSDRDRNLPSFASLVPF